MGEQLSPSDASSLQAEGGSIHVHVGGTAIFSGDPPAYGELCAHVERRLELIPRFRQRVRHLPGKVGRPSWEDDPDFDIARHVIHLAVPSPGSDAQLRDLVGRIMSQPLDLERPLWQIYLIEALEGNRFAALSKTHHALVDGIAAVDVGAVILDPDPEGTDLDLPEEAWRPNARRTEELVVGRAREAAGRLAGPLQKMINLELDPTGATSSATKTARGFLELARNSDPVRPTPLNVKIGRDRRVAYAATTLETMKEIARAAEATVNDVLLSSSAGALRRWFEDRGEAVPEEFVALVPMSIRKPGEEGSLGNRITTLLVPLPLDESDPIARLHRINRTTAKLKASEGARAASLLIEASGMVPPTINRVLGQMGSALGPVREAMPQRVPWNLVISNVPGPPMPVYLLGRRLEALHPYVPLSPQRRALSIGAISYDGGLYFGLVGDRDRLADLDRLASHVEPSIAEHLEAS